MANEILRRLAGGGRTSVFLSALVVILIALFLPGRLGAIAVLAIVGAAGWLLTRTWPVTPPRARIMRMIVLLALVAIAVFKARH